jgi:hypothetical protein
MIKCWLDGDCLLLRDFGFCVQILINARVVITVAFVMLLVDSVPYGIMFLAVFAILGFPVFFDGHITSVLIFMRLHFPLLSYFGNV